MASITRRREQHFPYPSTVIKNPIANALTWNGQSQTPTFKTDVSHATVVSNGETDVGEYTCTVTPNEGYTWANGTTTSKTVTWQIMRAYLQMPQFVTSEFEGDGQTHTPVLARDSEYITLSGDTSSNLPGMHTAYATPDSNHCWQNGIRNAVPMPWSIGQVRLSETSPSFVSSVFTYDGTTKTPTLNESTKITSSIVGQINAGTYTVSCTPASGYLWYDGTSESRQVTWTINKALLSVSVPTATDSYEWTGSAITPSLTDGIYITKTGDTSATNVDDYTMNCVPDNNHLWSDGTFVSKSFNWSIIKAKLSSLSPTWGTTQYSFDGGTHAPTIGNADAQYIVVNAISQWKCDTYTATARPDDNHTWSDGSETVYSTSWSIVAWQVTSGSGTFTLLADRQITLQLVGGQGGYSTSSGDFFVYGKSYTPVGQTEQYYPKGGMILYPVCAGNYGNVSNLTLTLTAGEYSYSVGAGGTGRSETKQLTNIDEEDYEEGRGEMSIGLVGNTGGTTTFGSYSASGGTGKLSTVTGFANDYVDTGGGREGLSSFTLTLLNSTLQVTVGRYPWEASGTYTATSPNGANGKIIVSG